MRRLLLVATLAVTFAGTAEALTIRDIIELTRAGLGDDVLLALIEVDGGVYAIDPATLKQLKAAGVSDRVMVALVRSGRERTEPPAPMAVEDVEATEATRAADAPPPQVVVIEHHDPVERVREVPVAVPVYIPVRTRSRHGSLSNHSVDASDFVPFQSGPPASRPVHSPKTEPVYWGWGGKLRPDAWQPPSEDRRHSERVRQHDRKN
jgi:hypothetical protein